MIKKILKVTAAAVAAVSMFSQTITASAFTIESYSEDLTVYYDALELYTDGAEKPCIINNRVMLPLGDGFDKIIGENKVAYDEEAEKATFYPDEVSIEFENESLVATQNFDNKWEEYELDVPALVYNNSFYVPIRAFGIINSIPVRWDADMKTVFINDLGTKDDVIEEFDYSKTVHVKEDKEETPSEADKETEKDDKDGKEDEEELDDDKKDEAEEDEEENIISEEEAIELAREKALELFEEEIIDACEVSVKYDENEYTISFEGDSVNVVVGVSDNGEKAEIK